MFTLRIPKTIVVYLLSVYALSFIQGIAFAEIPAAPSAKLLIEDCAKCHIKPPDDIAINGRKHKTEVGCQDCHNGHPPETRKIIPLCSKCHEEKPHFKLPVCLSCHSNPHTPLVIAYGNNVTDACVTCHAGQIVKLRDTKSKHSALACSFCHSTHGKIPNCTQCHKPHYVEQNSSDCIKCHQAHSPKNVTYSNKLPSKECAACHKKAYELLSANTSKHRNLSCAACHQAKHKMLPLCQSCHGNRHPASMLANFPKCSMCHNIAHDLNNFTVEVPPAPAKNVGTTPKTKKSKKK
jgi:hypothetical protein